MEKVAFPIANQNWDWIDLSSSQLLSCEQMEYDQALLERVGDGTKPNTVRLYRWDSKCVTIGRLQDEFRVRREYPSLPIYRRPTGGRAVVHGDDLTITVATRAEEFRKFGKSFSGVTESYQILTKPLHDTLRQFGLITENSIKEKFGKSSEHINCFATVERCDFVDTIYGIKRVGCAMRRTDSSILLQISVRPLENIDIFAIQFTQELRSNFERCLNIVHWSDLRSEIIAERA